MIDVNKEAEEFLKSKGLTGQQNKTISEWMVEFLNNSKAIQAKVLQAQIDLCNRALSWSNKVDPTSDYIEKELIALQQQLKQLENEIS
jgi:hypothetical protein